MMKQAEGAISGNARGRSLPTGGSTWEVSLLGHTPCLNRGLRLTPWLTPQRPHRGRGNRGQRREVQGAAYR
jgi:hypothetical protein